MKLWLPVLPALMLVSQAQAGTVRVLLARQASVELRSDESLVVTPRGATGQWGEQAEVRGPLVAKPCAATVCAGSVRGTLIHVQTEAAALQIGARRLPNELSLSVEGGELRIIAELDIEVYLEGVLGREMSPGWPVEALKAQAVIARTFTYRRVSEGAGKAYDIQSTTADQVFEWGRAAGNTIRTAVVETEGWIITVDGSPIEAFFHADSGGHTAGTQDVWDKASPGIEARADEYSLRQSWSVELDAGQDGDKLGVGRLKSISIVERVGGGRAKRVEVRGSRATQKMSADQFRGKLGYARVKSAMFEVRGLRLEGRGYGHGIGMSQTGAKKMAELGYDWQDILDYYYPGTVLIPAE